VPYAQCDDINIYYELEGQGPPLVLGHGGSYTIDMWKDWGYTDLLKDDFQLILLDFRGHGRSDKVTPESASGSRLADDVIAVLDDIGILLCKDIVAIEKASLDLINKKAGKDLWAKEPRKKPKVKKFKYKNL